DGLRAVLVPKAESAEELAAVAGALPGVPLVPLIETAAGLAACAAIARSPHVERLAFGALDFGADVAATSTTILDFARCRIVVESRAAGLPAPWDSPNPEFHDGDVVRQSARAARALGFGGQLCIHPSQVAVVAEAFHPTSDEIAWARRVIDIDGQGGAVQLDGTMVDRPVLLRAHAILQHLEEGAG
ncbi:MAG: aldolase/citrate lyase family protein, partial [Microbacterium sp.]